MSKTVNNSGANGNNGSSMNPTPSFASSFHHPFNHNSNSLLNSGSSLDLDSNNNSIGLDQHFLFNSKTNFINLNNLTNNLSMLNKAFDFQQLQPQQQANLLHQQCGICGKDPMVNGKTLVGCLHSFCHPCLLNSAMNNSFGNVNQFSPTSIITCPICSQESLIPNGGIDALMPHYSNPILLSLNNNFNVSFFLF